jgi:hypothetical protein
MTITLRASLAEAGTELILVEPFLLPIGGAPEVGDARAGHAALAAARLRLVA